MRQGDIMVDAGHSLNPAVDIGQVLRVIMRCAFSGCIWMIAACLTPLPTRTPLVSGHAAVCVEAAQHVCTTYMQHACSRPASV